jgi:hypothetical protein
MDQVMTILADFNYIIRNSAPEEMMLHQRVRFPAPYARAVVGRRDGIEAVRTEDLIAAFPQRGIRPIKAPRAFRIRPE